MSNNVEQHDVLHHGNPHAPITAIMIEMLTGDKATFEVTPELMRCYVTGKPNTRPYSFGARVIIGLTEEAFAHFIIEAGKDPIHTAIVNQENEMRKAINNEAFNVELLNLETFKGSKSKDPTTQDHILDVQSRLVQMDVDFATLLAKKGQSGLRILRKLKKQYAETGRLP